MPDTDSVQGRESHPVSGWLIALLTLGWLGGTFGFSAEAFGQLFCLECSPSDHQRLVGPTVNNPPCFSGGTCYGVGG